MIFVFLKVGLEHTGDEIKKVLDLRITKTGQDGFHKGIIGKFLQVNHQGFFIGLPIQAETDQAIIVIDKFMVVPGFVHGCIISYLVTLLSIKLSYSGRIRGS
jgi:hypothetical protein